MTTKYQPGVRVSEYILEQPLGMGTFGEVWRARHHIWESERVAVKLPTEPDYVRYLQREGVMVHGLRHQNIVRVMGLDPYAENPYLVMELIEGPSLRAVLTQHPTGIGSGPTLVVLRGVLAALSAAHTAGVLHRDLKPGNVLLHLAGRGLNELRVEDVRLSDFGLGHGHTDVVRSIAQSASLARDDALVGTLAYMAPEVRDGSRPADARSDLYSLGIMLFEMLTGERPAGAELPSTIRADVTPALDEVFRKLYARYDRRYESAEAVLKDLDARLTAARPAASALSGDGSGGAGVLVPPPIPAASDDADRRGQRARCPRCSHPVEPYDQFCTQCRFQLVSQVRKCRECGAFPGPDDRYCIFCGAELPVLQG